jgi:Tfp pilus assembly protein PilF
MIRASSVAFTAAVFIGALSAGPTQAGVQVLGKSLASACSSAALGAGSSLSSLDTCTRALTEEPLTAEVRAATLVNRGILQMRRRSFEAASQDFERALQIQPEMGEVYANRGAIHVVEGRFREGVADFNRALALGLEMPERTYFNRAVAREWLDDAKGAYLDYRKAAELNPEWPSPREQMVRFTVVRR